MGRSKTPKNFTLLILYSENDYFYELEVRLGSVRGCVFANEIVTRRPFQPIVIILRKKKRSKE